MWLSFTPAYLVVASSTTQARMAGSIRWGEARPVLPWTRAAGPACTTARRSRESCRSLSPSWLAPSANESLPSAIRFRV